MTPKLFFQALTKFILGLLTIGLLLFLPAGTFAYWQAWLFIGVLFVPMFFAGIVLMIRQPELLRKRWDATLPYIEQHRLHPWTHNKTIQKAIESYRITDEQKALLIAFRVK